MLQQDKDTANKMLKATCSSFILIFKNIGSKSKADGLTSSVSVQP